MTHQCPHPSGSNGIAVDFVPLQRSNDAGGIQKVRIFALGSHAESDNRAVYTLDVAFRIGTECS